MFHNVRPHYAGYYKNTKDVRILCTTPISIKNHQTPFLSALEDFIIPRSDM